MPPKRLIYPVFLPHAGCPFACVYCNQFAITSASVGRGDVVSEARAAIAGHAAQAGKSGKPGEVAFYGGTFTALPREQLKGILESAALLVGDGAFTGIRFSTRPDCLDGKIADFLARFPVTTVELGVQSLSDRVLDASGRGYAAQTAVDAASLVRERGWTLGIQIMAGLPGDSDGVFFETARRVADIGPEFVRIYPTVVLEGSRLAEMFRAGAYRPLDLEEAICRVVPAFDLFTKAGIAIARMGLHADRSLDRPGVVLAGPHHPAFGYLVRSRWWRDRVERELAGRAGQGDNFVVRVAPNLVSDAAGPAKANILYWESMFGLGPLKLTADPALSGTQTVVERLSDGC